MATARDELEEVSKSPIQQFAQELKEKRAREEEALPTIREVLAEIGRDPEKYGDILDKSGSMAIWEEVYKPQNALETGALTLLTAARQSGADPEEYLSRLAPYFDSKVEYLPRLLNALGMVEYGKPRTATLTATSKALGRMGGTLPHELEHTLQKTRKDAPGYGEIVRFPDSISGQTARRFGTWDERYDDLQERLAALPEEQRNQITDEHPVFGRYLGEGTELMARLRAAEMLEAARGGDFYQSEMGQALFPTDDDKAYMVGSTLPGEANITPPWSFERTDEAPTSVEDKRKSYARRLLEMLPGYQDGGEVSLAQGIAPYGIRWSDVTTGQPPVQAKGLGYMGKIPNESGDSMTELSTTFEINGQPIAAPLIVPGLTQQEIQALQQGSVPESVYAKAYQHALQRLAQGQDPFATGQDLRRYQDGGEVQPLQPGYLRFPEEARRAPTTSAEDLQRLGTQAGLIGLGFAPGAGMADYLGYFPSAQGGTEPSAMQNIQQGNYGTAAMQGLGAMGDLMYAVPFLGATVGSAMKGPRTAQRMLQELPKVDELGFYSQVEKAVLDNPQKKGTGEQFLAQIQKTPGVKQEELQYTGLDQFLASKPSVTKDEILDYLDANKVQVQEVQVGGTKQIKPVEQLTDEELADAYRRVTDLDVAEEYGPDWRQFRDEVENEIANPELEGNYYEQTDTKFSQYTLPGGENYREVLLTLPESGDVYRSSHFDQPNILAHMRVNDRTIDGKPTLFIEEIQSDWHQEGRKIGYAAKSPKELEQMRQDALQKRNKAYDRFDAGEITVEERNRLLEEATALLEKKILLDSGVPDAPFKTTWDELTLKRAIKLASDEGYDQIAFTTGKTQADRYDLSKQVDKLVWNEDTGTLAAQRAGGDTGTIKYENVTASNLSDYIGKEAAEKLINAKSLSGWRTIEGDDLRVGGEGMKGFYDKMLPKKLEKIGKKYGAKVTKKQMKIGGNDQLANKLRQNGYDPENIDFQQILSDNNGRLPNWLNDTDATALELGYTPSKVETVEVWTMQLPDDLKETVSTQGQPLFQIGAGAAGTAGIMSLTGEEAEAAQ